MFPAALIEQRRRLGLDRRDEVWDGELHMVPSPGMPHQCFADDLLVVLRLIAKRRGLLAVSAPNIRDPDRDWDDFRVPDIAVLDPRVASEVAIEGPAEIVVEVLSPNDDSRAKFGFYARRGVREVWIADPKTRTIEVFALRGDRYELAAPIDGVTRAPALALEITHEPLRVRDGDAGFDV